MTGWLREHEAIRDSALVDERWLSHQVIVDLDDAGDRFSGHLDGLSLRFGLIQSS